LLDFVWVLFSFLFTFTSVCPPPYRFVNPCIYCSPMLAGSCYCFSEILMLFCSCVVQRRCYSSPLVFRLFIIGLAPLFNGSWSSLLPPGRHVSSGKTGFGYSAWILFRFFFFFTQESVLSVPSSSPPGTHFFSIPQVVLSLLSFAGRLVLIFFLLDWPFVILTTGFDCLIMAGLLSPALVEILFAGSYLYIPFLSLFSTRSADPRCT